jgi:HEAT repeat protein
MRALGLIAHPSAVAGLIQTLGNVRKDVLRAGAADALLEIHEAHPSLHLEALAQTRGEVRQLSACGDQRAATPLCGWLFAPDPTDRILATRGLARLGDSSVLDLLEETLKDNVPEVCRAAAAAMQVLDPDRDWDPLVATVVQHMTHIEEASGDVDRIDDLLASIDFLGRLKATLALPTLHGLEEHPEWAVREAATQALEAISASG